MPLRYAPLLLLLAALAAPAASAQTANECADATAESFLDIGGVRALLFNNGALFWRGGDHIYEVPKGSGLQSQFTAGLWVGGEVDGNTRFSGTDYGPYEFWPGPLDDDGEADADLCAAYDRIWRVSVHDVARYNATGVASADLADWPAEAGAPVVDGDGDPDNYDLGAGDRPAILGEQTAWWIMNDRGGLHTWSELPPPGLEVRATAFALSDAYATDRYLDPSLGDIADVATFYRYEVAYRGDAPLENARISLFNDPDLGFAGDDYVGADSLRAMGFVYNGDDDDEGSYGSTPPALGTRMIGVDPADTCINYWLGGGAGQGNPNGGQEAYQYQNCRWRDNSPLTYGGNGYFTGAPTTIAFPDDPPSFWSEDNIDGFGQRNLPSDRRFLVTRALGTLQPGDAVTFDLVMPWARVQAGRFQSVRVMKFASDRLAALPFEPDPRLQTILPSELPTSAETPPEADGLALSVGPNPVRETATLHLSLNAPAARARLAVYDALGREVAVVHRGPLGAGSRALPLDASAWAPGVYVARLETETATVAHRFVVAR